MDTPDTPEQKLPEDTSFEKALIDGLQGNIPVEEIFPAATGNKPYQDLTWKAFFNLTGGSLFYCLSAVFITYGIVNMLGPILSSGQTLREALPCLLTLHGYEIALLAVLILIVGKKVVDDAISLMVLIALYLIGTSIAVGSIAEKNMANALTAGIAGVALGLIKLGVLKRWVRVPFNAAMLTGLGLIVVINYLGPVWLTDSLASNAAKEMQRRGIWMALWYGLLAGGGLMLLSALQSTPRAQSDESRPAYLQSPAMAVLFGLILLAAACVHQYSMSFTFTLERTMGDYCPAITLGCLLLIEVFRLSGKRAGMIEFILAGLPLAAILVAIDQKSVVVSGKVMVDLIAYPPVFIALSGLAVLWIAWRHRLKYLSYVACAYGLGVILTMGFRPEAPYALHYHPAAWTLAAALMSWGLIKWQPYFCLASIGVLCVDFGFLGGSGKLLSALNLAPVSGLAGFFGLATLILGLIFGAKIHRGFRIVAAWCLTLCLYDLLPNQVHFSYLIVVLLTAALAWAIWIRHRDWLVAGTLMIAPGVRLYMLSRHMAQWRYVILGFLLLIAGAVLSLIKRPKTDQNNTPEEEAAT